MSNTPLIFWLVPVASLIALGFAWHFFRSMMKESEGTPRMKEIAAHVRKGAMAYLRQQYRVVAIVFLILVLFFAFLAYGLGVQNPWRVLSGCVRRRSLRRVRPMPPANR